MLQQSYLGVLHSGVDPKALPNAEPPGMLTISDDRLLLTGDGEWHVPSRDF